MSAPLSIAVFFTIWWVTLFAVLPFGVRSPSEAGETDRPNGVDPGAPVVANMGKKALWTTAIAAVVFVAVDAFAYFAG